MRLCDICKDPESQPVDRAAIHVKGRSSGALDICAHCIQQAEMNKSPGRSAAASARLRPWVPRELTDSEQLDERGSER